MALGIIIANRTIMDGTIAKPARSVSPVICMTTIADPHASLVTRLSLYLFVTFSFSSFRLFLKLLARVVGVTGRGDTPRYIKYRRLR